MKWIFTLAGCTLGGWLGWRLGAHVGVMTAYVLSVVGTGLGWYAGHWFVRAHLE